VHMIKLTATREITPYKWVHPGRRAVSRRRPGLAEREKEPT
jgi:hypothetical protein